MITSAITKSFVLELGQALHDLSAAGNTFKCALYTNQATLNADTTVYSVTNEVSGTGYSAGGETLTNNAPSQSNGKALFDFANVTFSAVTLTNVRGALIYNSTNGNRAVAVLNLGADYSPTAQDLNIVFPSVTSTTAIIRITPNG
jgi:hypothetical protein